MTTSHSRIHADLLGVAKNLLTWAETHQRFNAVADGGPLSQDIAKAREVIAKHSPVVPTPTAGKEVAPLAH